MRSRCVQGQPLARPRWKAGRGNTSATLYFLFSHIGIGACLNCQQFTTQQQQVDGCHGTNRGRRLYNLPLCAAPWRCTRLRRPSAGCPTSWPPTRGPPSPWGPRRGWRPVAGARCGAAGQAEGPVPPRPPGAPPCRSLRHKKPELASEMRCEGVTIFFFWF